MGSCLLIIYIIWFLLTIFIQSREFGVSLAKKLKRKDILNLLPTWTLFGPRPVDYSYKINYRIAGEESLKEIVIRETPVPLVLIFNANMRLKNMVSFIGDKLATQVSIGRSPEEIMTSMSYKAAIRLIEQNIEDGEKLNYFEVVEFNYAAKFRRAFSATLVP